MFERTLDRLILGLFSQYPPHMSLRRLESDVWEAISARQKQEHGSWIEGILAALIMPQYQIATVTLAITIGFLAGHLTTGSLNREEFTARQALNLQVFSAQDAGLFTYHGDQT